jgi:hypothetical protein
MSPVTLVARLTTPATIMVGSAHSTWLDADFPFRTELQHEQFGGP